MSIRQLASLGRWHGNRLTLKHDDCDDWTAFKRCMNGDGCTRSWTMQHPYLQHTSQGWQLVCVCVSRLPHPRCCVLITVDVSAHGLLATVQVYLLRLRIPPLLPASCCQSNTHTHTHQLRHSYCYCSFYNMQHTKSVELFPAKRESFTGLLSSRPGAAGVKVLSWCKCNNVSPTLWIQSQKRPAAPAR